MAMLALGMPVLLTGCRSGRPADDEASRLCRDALGSAVVSAGPTTTLAEVRATTMGPRFQPAKGAFPELPGSTVAAYCWTTTSPTSGTPGIFDSYAAVPGGRSVRLIGVGGYTGSIPSGAPVVP